MITELRTYLKASRCVVVRPGEDSDQPGYSGKALDPRLLKALISLSSGAG